MIYYLLTYHGHPIPTLKFFSTYPVKGMSDTKLIKIYRFFFKLNLKANHLQIETNFLIVKKENSIPCSRSTELSQWFITIGLYYREPPKRL